MSGGTKRVRTPEQMERNRQGAAERRRKKREAEGSRDREQWRAFVRRQAEARKAAGVQPVVHRRARVVAEVNDKPAETIEQFRARGGKVEVIPGYTHTTYTAGLPVRHYAKAGLL